MKKIFLASLLIVVAASAALLLLRTGGVQKGAPAEQSAGLPCAAGDAAATSTAPGTAKLTWDVITAVNLAGYRVYYGTASKEYLQPMGKGLEAGKNAT